MNRFNVFCVCLTVLLIANMAMTQKFVPGIATTSTTAYTFDGSVAMTDEVDIGTSNADTLMVLARAIYGELVRMREDVYIGGTTASDSMLVKAMALFEGNVRFRGNSYFGGTNADSLTIRAKTEFPSTGELHVSCEQTNSNSVYLQGTIFQALGATAQIGNGTSDSLAIGGRMFFDRYSGSEGKLFLPRTPNGVDAAGSIRWSGDTLYIRNDANSAWKYFVPTG